MSSRSASFGTPWVFLALILAQTGNGRSWQDSSRRLSTPRPCAAPRDGSRSAESSYPIAVHARQSALRATGCVGMPRRVATPARIVAPRRASRKCSLPGDDVRPTVWGRIWLVQGEAHSEQRVQFPRAGAGARGAKPRSGPRAARTEPPQHATPDALLNTRSLIGRASGGTPKLTMNIRADEEVNPPGNLLSVVQRCRDGIFSADLAAGPT